MDAELLALANTAGATVVTLLATDAWETAKSAVGSLWQRVHPERAEAVQAELVEARAEVVAARAAGHDEVEPELVREWQRRLRRLLAADPSVAAELLRLLDEELTQALPVTGQAWTGDVAMRAEASGHGRVYQVGQGALHVNER
ncbi:hypothetical protein ACN26Y_18005 [Micromonospora sp. WMMD558]|uniref:hypothetical protein n=1 Tax=Micromonospora sp. WMMD558 TaxID=3403462 RepID=UPI003BF59507